MLLRGKEFGPYWDAAGARGFNGEGWWFHPLYRAAFKNFDFTGATLVGKTTTLLPDPGWLPLHGGSRNYAPIEWFPKCIWFSFRSGATLNAVALAGPGSEAIYKMGFYKRSGAFMASFMSKKEKKEDRLEEFRIYARCLKVYLQNSPRPLTFALQINISCPNTGLNPDHLLLETLEMLDLAAELGVPIIVKLNVFAPARVVRRIADHAACDAICGTNAIPFDEMKKLIPRFNKKFPKGSPLRRRNPKFGGGGFSSPELLPYVARWGRDLLEAGVTKGLNLGGGIRHQDHVDYLVEAAGLRRGVDSIFCASAVMVRPWQLQPIIKRAYKLLA